MRQETAWLRRNDGRVGYALAEDGRYTIAASFTPTRADWGGVVYRRVYIALYKGVPVYEMLPSTNLRYVMEQAEEYARANGIGGDVWLEAYA